MRGAAKGAKNGSRGVGLGFGQVGGRLAGLKKMVF